MSTDILRKALEEAFRRKAAVYPAEEFLEHMPKLDLGEEHRRHIMER